MVNGPQVLAIDLGTSGPKVAIVSAAGELVGGEFEPVELQLLPEGGAEQDPHAWWDAVRSATRRLLAGHPEAVDAISAIAVTSQWSGTVAVDDAGQPLGNAIIWMDSRGAPYIKELIEGPVKFEGYDPRKLRTWIKLTGGAPTRSGKDSIAHVLYLRHDRPDVYRAAACFLEPKDYLNLRLTGETVSTPDSMALHWITDNRNPAAVAYADELLTLAGLDRSKFPPLRSATDTVGTLTAEAADHLGLAPGLPVIGGTPDLHSAAIGAGTTDDLAAHLYLGTSAWLICHVPFKKTDVIHNIGTLPAAIPGRYIVANEQETAGKTLDWLSRVLYQEPGPNVRHPRQQLRRGLPGGDRRDERNRRRSPGRKWRPGLHTVVARRAHAGRRLDPPGGLLHPGTRHRSCRDDPFRLRRCRLQHPVAARSRRALRRIAARPDRDGWRRGPTRR